MKLFNFTIVKLTICLIAGIIASYFIDISREILFLLVGVISLFLILSYSHSKRRKKSLYTFGILTYAIFILIGILSSHIYDETNRTSHYINSNFNTLDYQSFSFTIAKRLKPDKYNNKYIVEIQDLNDHSTSGKLLMNLKLDSLNSMLQIGDSYYVISKLSEVIKPKNPFQFNYNAYLKQRNIHHQFFANHTELLKLSNTNTNISSYADQIRTLVNTKLKQNGFKTETLSIINALILGQRQDISVETYNNYVNAGSIHILAVSGLHVGIIFILLVFILKPLHRIKHGKHIYKPILILLFLWGFAFVAGLSPSVTRAVTMFSIITTAQFLKRPTNIINTLSISAFILLLFKPIYLFDVGFQMSYLAVFAIVIIQPRLVKLWDPKNLVANKLWEIATVTIAAQIGVAPISLFYFHQFPGLFFISNLVIIPFLGAILGFGILIIVLALFNILPSFLGKSYEFLIDSLNNFVAWVAQFESFLFRDISFSILQVLSSYLVIIAGLWYWNHKSAKSLQLVLMSVLVFSLSLVYDKYTSSSNEFVVFNKSRATILGEKTNNHFNVYHNLDSLSLKKDKAIINYSVGNFIESKQSKSLNSVYSFNDKIILVIDSLGIYQSKLKQPDYILLKDSPKLNMDRLIDSLQPKQIIADASNYKSYVNRWKLTCEEKNIPFHSTYEKGAFIIKD